MKSAILCFPFIEGEPQYPTGLYKIASLCQNAYAIYVLDQRLQQDVFQRIDQLLAEEDVLCLGISCMTGPQISSALKISKQFHGRVPIVWGGPHPTLFPKQTVENPFVDFIIRGDGEEGFLLLLKHIEKGAFSAQSVEPSNDICCFGEFPSNHIDFGSFPISPRYFLQRDGMNRGFNIETSRGCPHRCGYCHNSATQRPYSSMAPPEILAFIDEIAQRYSIDGIIFQEDNFFVDRNRVHSILLGLRNKGLRWKANARISYVRLLSDDFLELIEESGCSLLQFGVESGSQRILNMISKNITLEEIRLANERLAQRSFPVKYNFMVGFPGETSEEVKATLDFMEELRAKNPNLVSPFLNIYTPYPGTPLFTKALQHGFVPPNTLEGWSHVTWNSCDLPWLSDETRAELEAKSNQYLTETDYAKFLKASR